MWNDDLSDDDHIVTTGSAFIRRFVPETCAVLLFFLLRLKASRNACSLFSLCGSNSFSHWFRLFSLASLSPRGWLGPVGVAVPLSLLSFSHAECFSPTECFPSALYVYTETGEIELTMVTWAIHRSWHS